jgi:hypothetical protein
MRRHLLEGAIGDVGDGMDIATDADGAAEATNNALDNAMDEVDDATVGSGDGKVNAPCLRCRPSF